MSITNGSVNVRATTEALEAQLAGYEESMASVMELPDDEIDDSFAEWLASGIELIEDELARREDDSNDPAAQGARQAEQDADEGIEMRSYAS